MRLHRVHAAVAGFVAVFSAVLGGVVWDAAAVCPLPSDPQQQLEIVISIVDVNRDGGLSLAEIQALYPGMISTYFTFADGNRDGKITAAELMPWLSLLPGMNLLGLVDVNLNRAIEYSEVAAYVTPEQFALVDINGDGVVDCLDIGGGPVEGEGEGEDPVEGEGEDPGDPPCPIGDVTADTLVELVLILVDTSGDGSLSLGEVRAVYPELESVYFTLLDSNRNGLLDAAELAALTAFLPLDDFLGEVDLNGDGLVAYAEVSQYVTEAQFALADLNGNGFVDCEDIDLLTGGTDPGEGEGEDPVEGEGEPTEGEGEPGPPCPIDFSIANIAAVVVSLLDTDGNGGLSLAEIEAIYPDMEAVYFTILDSNRDGKITAAELAAIATILPVDSYIGMVDPNGDGVIAYAEVSQYLTQAQFDLIDTNDNGVIDCVDVAALTGGVVPVEGEPEGEGEDPVEGEGEPVGPCPIDFSNVLQTLAPVVVSLLDSNGDGGVSLAEIQTVYPEMEAVYFTLLDANRDGKITASELSAVVGILPVGSFIGMIDPNGDGLIAYSEVSQYLSQPQFDLVDTNNNGVIDCVDVAALTGGVIPGEGEPEGEPGEGEGEPGAPCPVLDALDIPAILGYVVPLLDRDGDGGLSLAEIQAVYADLEPMYFTLVDLNHDGKVTAAELGTLVNILPLDQLLGGIDPNGDGVFSYDEVSEYIPEELFGFLDANANGVIDCEDIASLLAGGWIPFEGEPPVDPDACPIPPLADVLAEVILALVDTDGDGGVSLAEVQAVYAAFEPSWFGLVDENGDGLVDAAELLRISGALPLDDLLGFVDANGNRAIEYAEVSAFVTPEQFAEVDENGDGVVDCLDVAALVPGEGEPEGEEGEPEGEGEPGEGEPEGEGEPGDVCPIPLDENLLLRTLLILFDGNGDGVISPAELGTLGVPPVLFDQFDGNDDGVLDLVELRRALRAAQALGVMQADLNGNGALEYAEVSAYVTPAQFALVDLNADGVLDCRDFEGIAPVEGEPEGEGEPGEGEGEPGVPEDWLIRLLERLRASGDLAALLREAFALLDADGDGALSYAEITARFSLPPQVFAALDANRDGLITAAEIEAFVGAGPGPQPVRVDLTRTVGGRFNGQFFVPGEPLLVTVRLVKRGAGLLNSLSLLEVLPAGWTITSIVSTAGGAAAKADGVNNALSLTWAGTMPFPIEVVYEALPAVDAPRIGAFAGQADYAAASGQAFSTGVIPTVVARALPPEQAHTADTNRDWRISLAELLRVVQLYNAGGYRAADGTEDGFAPGRGPLGALLHSADMDGDGNIGISELLRTIQLFNAPEGAYYVGDGTEDGYVPGVY